MATKAKLDMNAYSLQLDALLQWFPIADGPFPGPDDRFGKSPPESALTMPFVRPFSVKLWTTDFGVGVARRHMVGVGAFDGFPVNNRGLAEGVSGSIIIAAPKGLFFSMVVEIRLGKAKRSESFFLLPDTRTPFMLNLAPPKVPEKKHRGTALSLHGVFVTGRTAAQKQLTGMGQLVKI